jgi:regulator of sigma E protease
VNLGFTLHNILAFALTLGILIFVHEFGHFAVAKLLKIRVEVFSLGFGPRLLGWRRGNTDYRISVLPLGGYVKMAGENPGEEVTGSSDEFLSRPKWERFLVLVMGATLNIVLAILITAGIFIHGIPVPKYLEDPPVVGEVEPGSPAEVGGLQPLDQILSIGDTETPSWRSMTIAIALNPEQRMPFIIQRDGVETELDITIGKTEREAMGRVGIRPYVPIRTVSNVDPTGPAGAAGMLDGDQLLSVNGMEIGTNLSAIFRVLAENTDEDVEIVYQRGNEELAAVIRPAEREEGGTDPGFVLENDAVLKQYGPFQSLVKSVEQNWESAGLLFATLKRLVVGKLSPKALSGPIDIYKFTGQAWRNGGVAFFSFMSLVSLQLGIINLLPIPVLDGGHIFILGLEGLIRRDLSLMVKERVMQVGIVLLLLLMGTVLSLDVYKNFIQ